jgi:hypothetical protein
MKHQSNKDRADESLGMRQGKESTKIQSMESRRHESMGSKKSSKGCKMGLPTMKGHKGK